MGSIGLSVPALGVRPHPFGTALITSLGMMSRDALDMCFVPQTPFTRVPITIMVGGINKKVLVDETTNQPVVRDVLLISVTVDHRLFLLVSC